MQAAQNALGRTRMIQLRENRRQPQVFKLVLTINFREKPSRILKNFRLRYFYIFDGSRFNACLHKGRDIRERAFFQQDNYCQPPQGVRILTLCYDNAIRDLDFGKAGVRLRLGSQD